MKRCDRHPNIEKLLRSNSMAAAMMTKQKTPAWLRKNENCRRFVLQPKSAPWWMRPSVLSWNYLGRLSINARGNSARLRMGERLLFGYNGHQMHRVSYLRIRSAYGSTLAKPQP